MSATTIDRTTAGYAVGDCARSCQDMQGRAQALASMLLTTPMRNRGDARAAWVALHVELAKLQAVLELVKPVVFGEGE